MTQEARNTDLAHGERRGVAFDYTPISDDMCVFVDEMNFFSATWSESTEKIGKIM